MTGTYDGTSNRPAERRHTWRERLFVLGGLVLAALWSAASLASGAGGELIGAVWMAAIAWAVLASLAGALRRGFRHRDWTAFRRHRFPDNGELVDWTTRTGRYAWLRQWEDRILRDDRHLR